MDKNAPEKIKLVYICGAARSGSTVLGLTLQQLPGFCHVGELYHVWSRGFIYDELCSCGIEFKFCPFWNEVTKEAFGSSQNFDAHQMKQDMRFVQRMRRLPQILFPWSRGPGYSRRLQNVIERLALLYKAIYTVSGFQVIVDSSKSPVYALLLSRVPFIEIHVIHLIRDSRAVAYSWQRKKLRHQPGSGRTQMPVYSSLKSAWSWNLANSLSHILRFASITYRRFRYEDFAADVQNNVARLLSTLQEIVPGGVSFDSIETSARGHAMGGNPMRFRSDSIKITLDDEWKGAMAKKEKFIATANTFPLLMLYGYRF